MKKYATMALFLMAIIWGLSYIGIENAIINGWGSFSILFVRTMTAAIILLPFTLKKSYKDKGLFINGALCGLLGFLGLSIQTFGQMRTTVSSTSFITSLYIVLVPLFTRLFYKKKDSFLVYLSCGLSIVGCFLLNLKLPFTLEKENIYGNILVFISAIFFALQIIVIGKATKKYDVLQLTTVELFLMAFMSLIMMLSLKDFTIKKEGLLGVLLVGIFSSGLCSFLQMFGQKYLSESISGIIMGMEAVFGALFAFIIYKETFNIYQIIGCLLIIVPLILMPLSKKKMRLAIKNNDDKT